MELHFLGRGAGFFTAEGNTSAYMEEGEKLLLLDCGETVFSRLQALRLLDGKKQVYVLISHLHFDHIGSLGSLALFCFHALHIHLQLVLPENEAYKKSIVTLLSLTGNHSAIYDIVSENAVSGQFGITHMRYVPTAHAPGMQCFSFVFDTPDGGVFYSADTKTTSELRSFFSRYPSFAHAYMDTSDDDFPGMVHVSLRELVQTVPEGLRSRVSIIHINSKSCIEKGKNAGFQTVFAQKDERFL